MSAENPAPARNANDRATRSQMSEPRSEWAGSRSSATNAPAAKTPSVRNWRARNADAPSWMARAMTRIAGVPSSARSTSVRNHRDIPMAAAASIATMVTIMTLPADSVVCSGIMRGPSLPSSSTVDGAAQPTEDFSMTDRFRDDQYPRSYRSHCP